MKQYGSDPATFHYQVVPSNTAPQTPLPRSLYVNVSGNVVITDSGNTTVTYIVSAGQTLPIRAYLITTATTANVVAWY